MKEGCRLGVSSRGMGTLHKKGDAMEVGKDFYLATAGDIVADPSAPNAFVQGVMEGVEWIWDNGIIKESEIAEYKGSMENAAKAKQTEAEMLNIWKRFTRSL